MKILDFGKNKGKILADCEEKYLKWLVSHEKVLAERNRWAARDARFILARLAEGKVFEKTIREWVTLPNDDDVLDVEKELASWGYIQRQVKNREKARMIQEEREIRQRRAAEDLGLKGNLNTGRAFSILR